MSHLKAGTSTESCDVKPSQCGSARMVADSTHPYVAFAMQHTYYAVSCIFSIRGLNQPEAVLLAFISGAIDGVCRHVCVQAADEELCQGGNQLAGCDNGMLDIWLQVLQCEPSVVGH